MRNLLVSTVRLAGRDYNVSLLFLLMLKLLADSDKPLSGYDLLKKIRELTEGYWTPPKSTIYPALRRLQEEGFIEQVDNNLYTITDKGRTLLEQARIQGAIDDMKAKILVMKELLDKLTSKS